MGNDQRSNSSGGPSPQAPTEQLASVLSTLADINARSQRLMSDFIARQAGGKAEFAPLKPPVMAKAFAELSVNLFKNPAGLIEAQTQLLKSYAALVQSTGQALLGQKPDPVVKVKPGDRRFNDEQWVANPIFAHLKQSYLLASQYVLQTVRDVDGVSPQSAAKVDFYTRQFIDAMAPTNFALTNPTVMQRTIETRGENLLAGLSNLLEDLERGRGKLRIKMTDTDHFELGVNVAVTPGTVVYQNDLMQLLQYAPSTEKVFRRPLLIIPPWINKYYILDLRPKNSFIKWAVEQDHTVFVISWVNPTAQLSHKCFDDYMVEGPLAALDAIEQATGCADVKAVGYCLGGTLLACTLAYLSAKGDARIKAATFLASMTDFSEPGELGVFIDEEQLQAMEADMSEKGYFDGANMAEVFNLLRANDLIWSFVVNNYLLGADPFPFDLLYWNSDFTRMPKEMHRFYLRKMYQENKLREPGGISLNGVALDLRKITTPAYVLSTKDDHIAPWRSTYALTSLLGAKSRFVLAASGHIAGVINPPSAKKYAYWSGAELCESPDDWLAGAAQTQGSWWLDWKRWLSRYNGPRVAARVPGDGALAAIEDAPGSYARVRADLGE